MSPNPQFPENLVTFTEEIPNRKNFFLCSADIFSNLERRPNPMLAASNRHRHYRQPVIGVLKNIFSKN